MQISILILSRHLCFLLNAQNIYCALADILQQEKNDLEFASLMVNNLNMILLTSSELFELRQKLKDLHNEVIFQAFMEVLYGTVFKSGLSKFCGRQSLKNFIKYGLLKRPYPLKFFKDCLSQNLLSPLLNTLSHFFIYCSE